MAEMIVNEGKAHKAEIIFYNVAANGNNGVIFTIPVPKPLSSTSSHFVFHIKERGNNGNRNIGGVVFVGLL